MAATPDPEFPCSMQATPPLPSPSPPSLIPAMTTKASLSLPYPHLDDGHLADPCFSCRPRSVLNIPFPNPRLATTALKAIQVDPELSPLVRRQLTVVPAPTQGPIEHDAQVLEVHYKATTNRMLRVAVNGFMESLKLVVEVMEQLDTDVLGQQQRPGLSN